MKGLIVIDNIPDHCKSCRIVRIKWDRKANIEVCECPLKEYEYIRYDDKKPLWCPLKSLPLEKMDGLTFDYAGQAFTKEMAIGWNACLNEILGEIE